MDVSRSGYYAYALRRASPNAHGTALVLPTQVAFECSGGSYGSRRMARELQAQGHAVGRYRVRRLMRAAGVEVRSRRRFRRTTDSRHRHPVAPNRLDRQFDVQAPNQAWGADITSLWTAQGWLYLAVVLDLFSRRVVGGALAPHREVGLVTAALTMALGRRQPPPGLLHHSDRGSQYACGAYQALLAKQRTVVSMSGKGNCWDNAVVERFLGSLKRERTDHRLYATHEEARRDVIDYIERFYNSRRRHSYLGYLSPMAFEAQATRRVA